MYAAVRVCKALRAIPEVVPAVGQVGATPVQVAALVALVDRAETLVLGIQEAKGTPVTMGLLARMVREHDRANP
jgi:hypothetical protein